MSKSTSNIYILSPHPPNLSNAIYTPLRLSLVFWFFLALQSSILYHTKFTQISCSDLSTQCFPFYRMRVLTDAFSVSFRYARCVMFFTFSLVLS